MLKNKLILLTCIMFLMVPLSASAAIINGGFETGDFSNWITDGSTAISTVANLPDGSGGTENFMPLEGGYMASISFPAMTGFVFDNFIAQDVTLGADDIFFNFAFIFWTYDEAPFDNPGFMVEVNGKTVYSMKAGDVGDGVLGTLDTSGDWRLLSVPVSGYYDPDRPAEIRISFNAGNTGDNEYPSGVFIDSNSLTMNPLGPVVPIPASLLLFASGLLGLVGIRRKMR